MNEETLRCKRTLKIGYLSAWLLFLPMIFTASDDETKTTITVRTTNP